MPKILVKKINRKTTISRLAVRRAVVAVYGEKKQQQVNVQAHRTVEFVAKAASSSSDTKKGILAGRATILGKENNQQSAQATKTVSPVAIKRKKITSRPPVKKKKLTTA
jgi:hypothetical protein